MQHLSNICNGKEFHFFFFPLRMIAFRRKMGRMLFFLNKFIHLFIYLFIYGCVGSSLLHARFLQLWRAGATLHCGARASHCSVAEHGLQAHGLQQFWHVVSVVVAHGRHVGSSWIRARTRVPCIGRQILNHCATREVRRIFFFF